MSYSILVTVNNSHYNNQKFFMYKNDDGESLTVFNLKEAETVEAILQTYPNVFSEIKIVPRSEEEIRLLETFWGENGRDLDFDFNFVQDDCEHIMDKLVVLDFRVSGIDFLETRRQIDENV